MRELLPRWSRLAGFLSVAAPRLTLGCPINSPVCRDSPTNHRFSVVRMADLGHTPLPAAACPENSSGPKLLPEPEKRTIDGTWPGAGRILASARSRYFCVIISLERRPIQAFGLYRNSDQLSVRKQCTASTMDIELAHREF